MSDQDTFVNGIEIISTDLATSTSASLYSYGGISILTTTPATNIYNAGGLLVMGGSVLQKNLILGGNMTILDTVESVSSSTGSIIISGGLGVNKTANINKLISNELKINGNATISNFNSSNITSSNLNVTGLSSLSNTFVTNITTQNISVIGTTSISNPVNSNHATTKSYVDSLLNVVLDYYTINSGTTISNTSTSFLLVTNMLVTTNLTGIYAINYNCEINIPQAFKTVGFSTVTATSDLNFIYNDIIANPQTGTHALAFGLGETLFPGVYVMNGAVSIAGSLILNGQGNSNSLFIIRSTAAFNTAASVNVTMTNGAQAKNIYWVAQDAIGLGASTSMPGLIFSNSGAIAVGADCILSGARLFTKAGAVAFGPGTLSRPIGTSSVNLRSIENFVIFTGFGGIANTGMSTYTGDISTNSGAITGFETATVNGKIYQAGSTTTITEIFHIATIGLFVNNVNIPNSNRTRRLGLSDVSLQGVATLVTGDNVNVKCKIDTQISDNGGLVIINNRILFAIS